MKSEDTGENQPTVQLDASGQPNQPPPPRRWPWVVAFCGVFLCVGFSMLMSIVGAVADAFQPPKPGLEAYSEVVLRSAQGMGKIAVINIEGMISRYSFDGSGQNMVKRVQDQLKLARRDPAVKAVLLKVDSPGGEVMASDNIHRAIENFTEETKKPVICCMTGIAASGGYYIASACEYIVADELTLTGSIGVIIQTVNLHGLMEKVGAKPYTIKSGKNKDALSPYKSPDDIETNNDEDLFQDLVMFYFDRFKSIVEKGRKASLEYNSNRTEIGRPLAADWEEFADGRILTGIQAHEKGFVDQLGVYDDAVKVAERLAGISGEAQLVRYSAPFDLSGILRFFVKAEDPKVKVDLGVHLPRLDPGRPYFLSPVIYK